MTLDLDHAAIVIADLDAAGAALARMGFRLTPKSAHRGPVPPDGAMRDWGSGNRCAMFRQGYLELLGIVDPAGHKPHLDRRLARYQGLHLIAFGTADAGAEAARLRAAGVAVGTPHRLGRDVPFGDGTRPGSFLIADLDHEAHPEADFILIEQETRDVLWQPGLLAHPNGAVSLERVTVASPDPALTIDRLAPVLGPARAGRFALAPGVVEVIGPADLVARLPGCDLPGALPCGVALAIGVADIAATRACLAAAGVPLLADGADLLRVGPAHGFGCAIEFIPEGSA